MAEIIAVAALALVFYLYADATGTGADKMPFTGKERFVVRRDLGPTGAGKESSSWECPDKYLPSVVAPGKDNKSYVQYTPLQGGARDFMFAFEVYDDNDVEAMKKAGIRAGFPATVTQTVYGDRVFCSLQTAGEMTDYANKVKVAREAASGTPGPPPPPPANPFLSQADWTAQAPGAEKAGAPAADWSAVWTTLYALAGASTTPEKICMPCYAKNTDATVPAGSECKHSKFPAALMPGNMTAYVNATNAGELDVAKFKAAFVEGTAANRYVGCSTADAAAVPGGVFT